MSVNTMHVLDRTGDTRTIWDPNVQDEVKAAKAQFDALKKKGYLAYRVNPDDGSKGQVMREFDPKAGKIIMQPQMVGG